MRMYMRSVKTSSHACEASKDIHMRMSSLTVKLLLEVLDVRDSFIQSARLPWCVFVCVRVRACVRQQV